MKYCQNCGAGLDDKLFFCTQCGTKTADDGESVNRCTRCHRVMDQALHFCTGCGQRLPQMTANGGSTIPVEQSVLSVQNQELVTRNRKPKKVIAIVAVVTCFSLLVWFNREALIAMTIGSIQKPLSSGEDMREWVFGGDKNPDLAGRGPDLSVSGTGPQTVVAGEYLTISVAENALDQERELVAEKLSDKALYDLAEALPEHVGMLFDAYHFSAGLNKGESIPGSFEMAYDLAETDIPSNLYPYVRVIRLEESGAEPQMLASTISGTTIKADTSQNSVIGFTILGVVYVSARTYESSTILGKAFGTDPYLVYSDPSLNRYTFY